MANKKMLQFHKMTEKEYDRLTQSQKVTKIQDYMSTTDKIDRANVRKNIDKQVENVRFDYANPDKVKQREAIKKAGYDLSGSKKSAAQKFKDRYGK